MKNFLLKLKESVLSVAPIALTVFVLGFTVEDFWGARLLQFAIGAFMLVIGITLFTTGADVAMVETGNLIGAEITKNKKLWIIILVCFALGLIITVAEPDLMVLADQLSAAINRFALILAVAIGVGVFMVVAMLRILFKVPLRALLVGLYSLVFLLAIFTPSEFLPLAFDSGGVTTGPMTVPFIMAFGTGIAAVKGTSDMEDSFGIVALCSVGPILAVMILGMFADTEAISSADFAVSETATGTYAPFLYALPHYMLEVAIALLPVLLFVTIFQFAKLKLSSKMLVKIAIGFVNVYAGLVIFLTGVSVGFAPVGRLLGSEIAVGENAWSLIPIGVLMGLFTVLAEPAIHVLTEQIGEISGGTIRKRNVILSMMLGVAVALGLAMTRVLTSISIWWLIVPGYAAAILLSFFSPKVFTAIAFDSGGVASGPMTATFILPFAVGASLARDGNILTDAFGLVALVAMTPPIAIQLMGVLSAHKTRKRVYAAPSVEDEVIDFDQNKFEPPKKPVEKKDVIDFDVPQKIKQKSGAKKPSPTAKPRIYKKPRTKSGAAKEGKK